MGSQHDLVVIGGGPAGSTTATLAARAGLRVLLLEASEHPRMHVGEGLLPGIIPILEEMDALAAVEQAGFCRKSGSTFWGWGTTESWDLWFRDTDTYDHAWFVERGAFDAILFHAARRAGVDARENAAAKELVWEGDRLCAVRWRERGGNELRVAEAPLFVDATGHAGLIARALDLRTDIESLRHQASWAHFEGAGRLPPPRSEQALFVAERSHWTWMFPLDSERTSIGVVRLEDELSSERRADDFDRTVRGASELAEVIGAGARRVTPVYHVRDWSYRITHVSGPGWMLAGDASGFIDPILSTGVFLAMVAARNAARRAVSIATGASPESVALAGYQREHETLFGDLLRMVRFYYQQNLSRDDYFWESKRILVSDDTRLKPQKAFLILTSGLVQNLALDERVAATRDRRERDALGTDAPMLDSTPAELGFVCFHLRHHARSGEPAALYLLVEPRDPADPTLFATRNWNINCIAPRYDNDPISVPELEPHLRELARLVDELDTVADESLAAFWNRARSSLATAIRGLPDQFELVRVFGE